MLLYRVLLRLFRRDLRLHALLWWLINSSVTNSRHKKQLIFFHTSTVWSLMQ
jgi:hypothetical protein